ncbi:multidrug transporter MatE [Bradyrhizobium sp. CCBAU 21362]|nr:multidrug transporter MatE [Bradyrhizobium sp. CCBAU 21362]
MSASRYKQARPAPLGQFFVELVEAAKLAFPMMLTQIVQIAMTTTDLALIGHMGAEALAAAALAGRIYLVSFTFGVGFLAPITSFVARAFAADNLTVARRSLLSGLWGAILLSLPIAAFTLNGERLLLVFGQAPNTARLAQQYLFGLVWSLAPALCFQVIRSFLGAVKRPEPALWITLIALPINALLVYLLIYGKLGLPRLELFGAGLATTLVNLGMLLAAFCFTTMRQPFRDYHLLAKCWRFDCQLMWQLIVIGTPISIASLIGYGAISAAALLAGVISTSALAAHQIALNIATILFAVAFGVSTAAAVRVSHAVGRGDVPGIKRAGVVPMLLGLLVIGMLTLAAVVARVKLAELFLAESAGDSDATIEMAAKLILVAASFFIGDAVASIAAGSLRGLNDTRVPLLFAGISYWPVGMCFSYLLGFKMGFGVVGIWIGLAIGTNVYAGLLVTRFQLLANKFVL